MTVLAVAKCRPHVTTGVQRHRVVCTNAFSTQVHVLAREHVSRKQQRPYLRALSSPVIVPSDICFLELAAAQLVSGWLVVELHMLAVTRILLTGERQMRS